MKRFLALLFVCFSLLYGGCRSGSPEKLNAVDLEKEKAILLASHLKDRKAHFDADPSLLLNNSTDTFLYVGDGKINYSNKPERLKGLAGYFQGSTYSRWEDMEAPVIRISDDGTLAWMITRLDVSRIQKDSTGKITPAAFVYAGVIMYKKVNGIWLKEANVSTFEPEKQNKK